MNRCTEDCKRPRPGTKIEHCTACHQTFTSTSAGDKHRVGKHDVKSGPDRRRCRTEAEMIEAGLHRNYLGYWAQTVPGERGRKFAA